MAVKDRSKRHRFADDRRKDNRGVTKNHSHNKADKNPVEYRIVVNSGGGSAQHHSQYTTHAQPDVTGEQTDCDEAS